MVAYWMRRHDEQVHENDVLRAEIEKLHGAIERLKKRRRR
jgi:hypothetical protein